MATPRRIFRIYQRLAESAEEVRDFLSAKGERSGTVDLLVKKDRAKLLARWGEEMTELCGVLDGSHDDPYLMEATQCFYWAALFAVTGGATWEAIDFEFQRRQAVTSGILTVPELLAASARLATLAPERVKPEKLFLLWNVADRIYRLQTKPDAQWSLEQLMEADLQDMAKRPYLAPILRMVPD
jgi:phosphoribosyl-ATP pyrophosphohydrolase